MLENAPGRHSNCLIIAHTLLSDVSVQYWVWRLGKHKLSDHHPPS